VFYLKGQPFGTIRKNWLLTYYSAIDAEVAAEAIYKVATDRQYAAKLVANGKKQLLTFDNYEQRADKLIGILEAMASERKR